ncbi:hypothetical protein CROQUDRAFT_472923 [Cronartium quercuum f. sp. fusiforme G11]|uniref:Uncharacterized protein n=1 Tax=Cronartium quercuum f. sp. fusiforme G11 TaxID=708437 RepID=A0A9P6TD45_9BASI|nr:hypothetical protein CROQUDRAFT_472923 [Cronartium quercuum f. sp. fusiforme G11]
MYHFPHLDQQVKGFFSSPFLFIILNHNPHLLSLWFSSTRNPGFFFFFFFFFF